MELNKIYYYHLFKKMTMMGMVHITFLLTVLRWRELLAPYPCPLEGEENLLQSDNKPTEGFLEWNFT